jgi:hypothetical protein
MLLMLVAAVGLALALTAAPAFAKKKHPKKPIKLGPVVTASAAGNTTSKNGDESVAVATCPPGKQAIGGGFSAAVSVSGSSLLVHDSYRSSAQTWTAAARDDSGLLFGGGVTAFAFCRNATKSPVADATQSITLNAAGMPQTASASCPSGQQLVGGGFQSTVGPTPDDVAIIRQNAPLSGGWSATAANNTAQPQTLTAHAYCLAGLRPPTIITAVKSSTLGTNRTIRATTATCPRPPKPKKGKKRKKKKKPAQLLAAGGFSGPLGIESGPVVLWSASQIGNAAWNAAATNVNDPGSVSITSYGVCA